MPATKKMTDDQKATLVRNALLVAGHEMGPQGDHWPVINATIHSIMQDWENLRIERNVHEELRTHLYAELDRMEKILPSCPEEVQKDAAPKLKRIREIYDAHFAPIDEDRIFINPEDLPEHVKRAQAIIMTLEGNDD